MSKKLFKTSNKDGNDSKNKNMSKNCCYVLSGFNRKSEIQTYGGDLLKNVIVVLGKTACGKSAFSEFVSRHYGYAVYEVGDYVRKEYQTTSMNLLLVQFADAYYHAGKLTHFIKSAIKDAHAKNSCKIIFSGLRTAEELSCVAEAYPIYDIVQIVCRSDIRSQRYIKKASDGVELSKRTEIEESWASDFLDNVLPDYRLENNGSLEEFYQQIHTIFLTESGSYEEFGHEKEARH